MSYKPLLAEAKKELKMADYITYVTYPVIKDKQLFRSILEHLTKTSKLLIRAYLEYEMYKKKIKSVPTDDRLALSIFLERYSYLFNLDNEEKKYLSELLTMEGVIKSQKSNDFERGNKFFMISPTYKILGINIKNIKKYIKTLKRLNESMEKRMGELCV
jgi:hypothetical protein